MPQGLCGAFPPTVETSPALRRRGFSWGGSASVAAPGRSFVTTRAASSARRVHVWRCGSSFSMLAKQHGVCGDGVHFEG